MIDYFVFHDKGHYARSERGPVELKNSSRSLNGDRQVFIIEYCIAIPHHMYYIVCGCATDLMHIAIFWEKYPFTAKARFLKICIRVQTLK